MSLPENESQCRRGKYYYATDNLRSPSYRALLPEDLINLLIVHRLLFQPATETGVLFHMIGALSEFSKVGVTCIGDSREEADALFQPRVQKERSWPTSSAATSAVWN